MEKTIEELANAVVLSKYSMFCGMSYVSNTKAFLEALVKAPVDTTTMDEVVTGFLKGFVGNGELTTLTSCPDCAASLEIIVNPGQAPRLKFLKHNV